MDRSRNRESSVMSKILDQRWEDERTKEYEPMSDQDVIYEPQEYDQSEDKSRSLREELHFINQRITRANFDIGYMEKDISRIFSSLKNIEKMLGKVCDTISSTSFAPKIQGNLSLDKQKPETLIKIIASDIRKHHEQQE